MPILYDLLLPTTKGEEPDFIVHYSRSVPFRSISEVTPDMRSDVLLQLDESNAWGLSRFSDPDYLQNRLAVEERLRSDFISRGGKPELEFPIYFFLGRNSRFEENKNNVGYIIKLADIPNDSVSFTYGDSLLSFNHQYRQKMGERYKDERCSRIYMLDEVESLFSEVSKIQNNLHIECQLWTKPGSDIFKATDWHHQR